MTDFAPEIGEYRVIRETNSITGRYRWRICKWDSRFWCAASEPVYFRWIAERRARRWNRERSWVLDA